MTRRKSRFDLSDVAYLKVPKNLYLKIKEITPDNKHWSEIARNILETWLEEKGLI